MEGISVFFFVIFLLGAMFLFMFLMYALIAKVFNTRITYRGSSIADPDTLNMISSLIKNKSIEVVDKLKIKKQQVIEIIENKSIDKVAKVQKLAELKEKGLLTEEEFVQLKKELLK